MFINPFLVGRMEWLGFDAQENLTLQHANNKGADQPAQSDQRLITFAIVNLTPCKVSIFDSPLLSILKARSLKFQNCNCNFVTENYILVNDEMSMSVSTLYKWLIYFYIACVLPVNNGQYANNMDTYRQTYRQTELSQDRHKQYHRMFTFLTLY